MAKRKKKEAVVTEEAPVTETAVAVTEPVKVELVVETPVAATEPVAEVAEQNPSFAEKHPPKAQYPDPKKPFPLAINHDAGITLLKHDRFKQTQLAFHEKIPAELHTQLHQAGWTYRSGEGVYTKQYAGRGEALAILEAKRLFNALVEQLAPEAAPSRG